MSAYMSGIAPIETSPPELFVTRQAISGRRLFAYFALGTALTLLATSFMIGPVLHGELFNPDSYMRLARIHDMLAQGRVLDTVAADGSGSGTVLHWTHLLDGLLLALSLPLRPFLGSEAALFWAAALFGPLSVGVLAACAAWAVAPLADAGFLFLTPVAIALSHGTMNYGMLGEAHHHILVLADAVLIAGWAGRAAVGNAGAGWYLGLWSALGIWLTPETMPAILMGYGAVGIAWLSGKARPAPGNALARAEIAFSALIVVELLLDPPSSGYFAAEIDRLSAVWFALGLVVLAIGLGLYALDRLQLGGVARAAAGLALTLGALGLWLALYPKVLAGTDGLMTPEQTVAFISSGSRDAADHPARGPNRVSDARDSRLLRSRKSLH